MTPPSMRRFRNRNRLSMVVIEGFLARPKSPLVQGLNRSLIPCVLLVFEAPLLLGPALVAVAPTAPDDESEDAQHEAYHDDQDVRGVLQTSQDLAHAARLRGGVIGARTSIPASASPFNVSLNMSPKRPIRPPRAMLSTNKANLRS